MKLVCISDMHGRLPAPPTETGDAVIIAGDICPDFIDGHAYGGYELEGVTSTSQKEWLKNEFAEWLKTIPKPCYLTWGNHDRTRLMTRAIEESWPVDVHCIVDDATLIHGPDDEVKKVWFSPWVQDLPGWAWNTTYQRAAELYAAIPDGIDIIVSHAPPKWDGDLCNGVHLSSVELRERALQLPKLTNIICGHIHEDRGIHKILGQRHIIVTNVASVDGDYVPYPERWTIIEIGESQVG